MNGSLAAGTLYLGREKRLDLRDIVRRQLFAG
jgi:hypothetical protein